MRYLIFFVLMILALWTVGVRIHPEVLKNYLDAYARKDYRRLELTSGHSVIGEYAGESGDSVRLKVAGGFMTFQPAEIRKMTQITTPEIRLAIERGEILDFPKKPLITRKLEDSLIPLPATKATSGFSSVPSAASQPAAAAATAAPNTLPFNASAALEMAQKYQSVADLKRKQTEAMVRQMEEGDAPTSSSGSSESSGFLKFPKFSESSGSSESSESSQSSQ